MKGLGSQYIAEYFGCSRERMDDPEFLRKTFIEAAELAGAQVIKEYFHQFSPHGISGVVIIAESHLTVHCWPEHGYAAVDIFTCGDIQVMKALRHVQESIGAECCEISILERGIIPGTGGPKMSTVRLERCGPADE